MKITKKYGNTIYGDNTISKTITYQFDKMQDLHQFWQDTLDAGMTGNWTANLDRMTVEHSEFVDASEYLIEFAEFCKGQEEGIELNDGGTIYYPDSEGRIERVDYSGNTMEVRYPNDDNYDSWNKLMGEKAWEGEEE